MQKLSDKGLKSISVLNQIIGSYVATDIKDKTGNIIIRAGFDITQEQLEKIISNEEKSLQLVDIDPINKGPYILETLKN